MITPPVKVSIVVTGIETAEGEVAANILKEGWENAPHPHKFLALTCTE